MPCEETKTTKHKPETHRRQPPRLVQHDNRFKLIWKSQDSKEESTRIEADTRSIFVGNVAFDVSPGVLEEHFGGCGRINRITLVRDSKRSSHVGYGYLEFDSVEARDRALLLDGSVIGGMRMIVRKKRLRRPLE